MKRFIKCVCVILVLTMVLPVAASAAGIQNSRASYYFAASTAYLNYTSATTFQVCFSVTATGIMDELGASAITVQRRASENDPWESVKTYYSSTYTNLIDYDQATHSAYVTYYGTSGYEYRAYIQLHAKNDSGEAWYPRYAY